MLLSLCWSVVIMLYCYCVARLLFVLSYVLIVCTVPLPPGVSPIAVDKYINLKCSVWRLALRYDIYIYIYIYMSLGFKRLTYKNTHNKLASKSRSRKMNIDNFIYRMASQGIDPSYNRCFEHCPVLVKLLLF